MVNSMYYKETFLIAITLISAITADDYHSNEEVRPTSLDFFDAENNNEFYDPRSKQSPLRNLYSRGQVMPEPEPPRVPSSASSAIITNNILTTIMPGVDPVQTISSFTQQSDDEDIFNYTTTTSSAINEIAQDHYISANVSDYAEDQDDMAYTTTTASPTIAARSATVRMKQGKQIPISNLQPHQALRKFVEDSYIRRPLAILIDTAQDNLDDIKILWMDALRPNAPLDCVLLAYNASGVPITYNFTNTRMLLAGINSIRASENDRGNGFFGIIRAIELIPYDSAVFVSTALLPADENLAQYAATALLKKRIRLYLTWLGDKPLTENETHQEAGGTLGSVAVRSGGEVIFSGDGRSGDYAVDSMVTLFSDHLLGTQDQEIIVEPTVSDLHFKIDAALKSATLETPNGEINLLKMLRTKKSSYDVVVESKVVQVNDSVNPKMMMSMTSSSRGSKQKMTSNESKSNGKRYQATWARVHLSTRLTHPTKFHLRLQPENNKDKYRVVVLARNGYRRARVVTSVEIDDLLSQKTFKVRNLADSEVDFKEDDFIQNSRNLLQITHDQLRFPEESDDAEMTPVNDIIEVDKNLSDNNITISSRQEQPAPNFLNMGTVIEMGVQSQLLLAPGSTGQLYFEITNYRTEPVFHTFQVTGEQRFLVSLNIQSLLFAPGQMAIAIVTVRASPNTAIGTKDQITFSCQGNSQSSKIAMVKVVQTTGNQDGSQPSLHWNYGNRCDGNKLETGVCADNYWSVDVVAHDWGTGLLRIQSNPRGIYARNTYTAGTTSPVSATYSSSCCQPRVTISAYDLSGNARTISIDVRDIYLSEASIAAIVLGVILIILLIIALIALIVWCCRRRQEVLVLPSYQTRRRTSTT